MHSDFLKGVRVIGVTQVWAGPWAGGILADMGAEVIKIESKQKLDTMRCMPEGLNRGPNFNAYNRGEKSCTINLKEPKGVEIFKSLVKISDAVITNSPPRVLPSWGLDYAAIKAVKPDIIMVSIPGFGITGPDKNYISYAATVEAVGGLTASFGYPDGAPATPCIWSADPTGGLYGALCVCNAIYFRNKTGLGQNIDIAQNEAISTLLPEFIMEYTMNGKIRPRMGNRDEIMAPHGCYPCKGDDKWVVIAVGTDEEWQALCRVMGNPDWSRDEKFSDQYNRWQNQDELNKLIGDWTKDVTHYEVMHKLQKAGVAAGASLNTEELFNDPHVKSRGVYVELNHPEVGKTVTWRSPWASALTAENPSAPLFGQHNGYVFKALLGMSEDEIKNLTDAKVIY